MKQQILNRLGVAHVRDTMMQFVTGSITRQQAMESLQIGQSQLYSLRTSYLAARARGRCDDWAPGSSGGNHMPVSPRIPWISSCVFFRKPYLHSPDREERRV